MLIIAGILVVMLLDIIADMLKEKVLAIRKVKKLEEAMAMLLVCAMDIL